MTLFDGAEADHPGPGGPPQPSPAVVTRPRRWAPANWPVRWKVFAIALVPLLLAAVFGGLRIYSSAVDARDLRVAADRAGLVPFISDYMAGLENALVVNAAGGDVAQAKSEFDESRAALQGALAETGVVPNVRLAVTTLLTMGAGVLDEAMAGTADIRQQVLDFAPLLLTAETAITGSVRVDDEELRLQATGLARAVGSHGQMSMQRMLIQGGSALPEPFLRNAMTTLAGTEPQTVIGMSQLLGGASAEANTLRSQMVRRLTMMADPAVALLGNPDLLQSIDATDAIARQLIADTTASITDTIDEQATAQRNSAIRDAALVLAALLIALAVVVLVARSLTRPLRRLRDGALAIAHEELPAEIDRVKAGDEREPAPLPIHTTEEIGQVAHAVDELHARALLLAGDEARLRVVVNDMFETLSRRSRSLVDQQLSLIDQLERDEADPQRLDSLFRLDHLATRMRRNGANLLVLAGAGAGREHGAAVPLASLVNAAASEVEDYQRVQTGSVPDCSLAGVAAADAVHLLAELIDNALRYSPPDEPVRVSAVHTGDGGVLIDIDDAGLGMTEADLRIANTRLGAGGEVTPDSTRHMGLFVVGRLARRHGMTVRLLAAPTGRGTTAELHVPPGLVEGMAGEVFAAPAPAESSARSGPGQPEARPWSPTAGSPTGAGSGEPAGLLPRRSPGSSGITGAPERPDHAQQWWGGPRHQHVGARPGAAEPGPPADTSGFFGSRRRARGQGAPRPPAGPAVPERVERVPAGPSAAGGTAPEGREGTAPEGREDTAPEGREGTAPEGREHTDDMDTPTIDLSDMRRLADELSPHPTASGVDLIYQNMLSEWLVDPHELALPQDWKTVWDNGWAAAAEAETRPVDEHTDSGLPVREPGARLVPGGAPEPSGRHSSDRDPDAIRNSMSNHFGGVRAARSHAHNTNRGSDQQ
ncbi:sensor histidine kinase [Mycolicibacterium palauense]|uniref:sensor histidine kinase n=1 Tax=Mycolicibacterium palauense TaxID=2034511 RepID=UPI000BFEF5CC|nr:ATP-binding protein [Mycolicibacterium palauense]